MSFGDVIRYASSPSGDPTDIGGDASTIWHCDYNSNRIYELNTSDLSVVRSEPAPASGTTGVGGDASTIWHSNQNTNKIYELSTTDFSEIRSASSPNSDATGVGGDANTIWHASWSGANNKIFELSTTDFSEIRSASSPSSYAKGVGGTVNVIWHTDGNSTRIYELSITDFSVIRNAAGPDKWASSGIGGDDNTIWYSVARLDRVYELDTGAPPTYTLSGTISDEFGNPICDATITISNGTIYTTTSDENGDYSKVVNSDTYDIAISKSRSRYHDTTELSVTVTADTIQDITMPTDKMLGGPTIVNGMSIPGGISMGRPRR